MGAPPRRPEPKVVGRYVLFGEIASGGQASVHFGQLTGSMGFAKTVAIKRILPQQAGNRAAIDMLADEARLASRINHPNVVPTLDVVSTDDELMLVLEYVRGESFARLLRLAAQQQERAPIRIAAAIVAGALHGVQAAHDAVDENGRPLEVVHRDLSPHNIIVDIHGVPRVLDFGVAKALGRIQEHTQSGMVKGKLAYMAPEQVHGNATRASDLWSMGVVLWEALAGQRPFIADTEASVIGRILVDRVESPRALRPDTPAALEAVVMTALQRDEAHRFPSATAMAAAIEASGIASASEVAAWVNRIAAAPLAENARRLAELESTSGLEAAPAAKPRTSRRLAWALGAAVAAVIAIGGWRLNHTRETKPVETPVVLPVVEPMAPPLAVAKPEPDAGPSAPVAVTPRRIEKPRTVGKKPNPTRNCDPPFLVEANGQKKYKRECF